MASSYTGLGVELMVTGENAGTWGTKTNTNLNIIEQISGGYIEQAVNGTGATALTVTDGGTGSAVATRSIKLTGTITGNITVNIPIDVENFYFIENGTSGAYTVEFEYASGSGSSVTWSATDKGYKIINAKGNNAVNPDIVEVVIGGLPGGSNTQVQFNSSGAFAGSANLTFDGTDTTMASAKVTDLTDTRVVVAGTAGALEGDANLTWVAATALQIDAEKELRLGDASGAEYVGLKAPATVSAAYTLTMPAATGTADQILVTNGSGVLSFADNSGGTSWQAVKAADFTAVAGEGYFINTTAATRTMTLPASPAIGAEVSFVDYAGTFDSNALTIGRNSQPIQGAASDLTVSIERAANTLVYVDGTQGWLLKTK